jgi:hypothetical protein
MSFIKNDIMLALEDEGFDVTIVGEGFDYFTIEGDAAYAYDLEQAIVDIVGDDAIVEISNLTASIYFTIEV